MHEQAHKLLDTKQMTELRKARRSGVAERKQSSKRRTNGFLQPLQQLIFSTYQLVSFCENHRVSYFSSEETRTGQLTDELNGLERPRVLCPFLPPSLSLAISLSVSVSPPRGCSRVP